MAETRGFALHEERVTAAGSYAANQAGRPAPECAHAPAPGLLVLGFGNILLGDDGAGVRMLERLRDEEQRNDRQIDAAPDGAWQDQRDVEPDRGTACYLDAGTLSYSLLSHVESADSLLVLDAANLGAAPGTIMLLEDRAMDAYLRSARRRTVHEVGLTDLLDMARVMDCLPQRRALLCIQPGVIDWSDRLSPPLALAVETAVAQARRLLDRWRAQ